MAYLILKRILIITASLLVILSSYIAYIIIDSWPKTEGRLLLTGLQSEVRIVRDQWGVPNLYADNESDLMFSQGFIHAQDRLWQMEMNRLFGSGRLAEVFGDIMIEADIAVRTFGLRNIAEESWHLLEPETKDYLIRYAEGVNAYIDQHSDSLPIEFKILGHRPEKWLPIDSLLWGNLMSYFMGNNYRNELLRNEIIEKIGIDKARFLFPEYDSKQTFPAHYNSLFSASVMPTATVDKSLMLPERMNCCLKPNGLNWGSNNWVISGKHTKSGLPLIANDTHLSLSMDNGWYEIGLHGGKLNVIGFSFPGMPFVVIGHNDRIAWGVTNFNPDVQDLYIEKLDNMTSPEKYLHLERWIPLRKTIEEIKVKDKESISLTVLSTHHGPLINHLFKLQDPMRFGFRSDKETPLSLAWTLRDGSVTLDALRNLNFATDWNSFRKALQKWDTLSQNFIYADIDGNIGYQAAGKVPKRVDGHTGTLPILGSENTDWQGYLTLDELPFEFNPDRGYIVTANNKVVNNDYQYFLSYEWYPGYRQRRIADLIQQKLNKNLKLSMEDMKDIQSDNYATNALPYLDKLKRLSTSDKSIQASLDILTKWDLHYSKDSIGATLFDTWYLFFLKNTLQDEFYSNKANYLFDLYRDNVFYHVPALERVLSDNNHILFNNEITGTTGNFSDIALISLKEASDWLNNRYSDSPTSWWWGRVHSVIFRHMAFGRSGIVLLESLFNSNSYQTEGSWFSVNLAHYSWEKPFEVIFGTSQRMIVDLSDWDNMLSVGTTGQNQHLFHYNRKDQIELWNNLGYRAMPYSQEMVNQNNQNRILILTPKP